MASGDTLSVFTARDVEPPATNYATLDLRNVRPVLDFDQTTQEAAIFSGVLPRNYAGGGLTVYAHWSADVTTGTVGWDSAFERIGAAQQDLDVDGFATANVITAATVDATSGNVSITNVAHTSGAQMDSLAAGEAFRFRIRRDVATDTAAGDANLLAVEIKET